MENFNNSKCKICGKEINLKEHDSYDIINEDCYCIDCETRRIDKSYKATNFAKAIIILTAILGFILGIILGLTTGESKSDSSTDDYSYSGSYSYYEEDDDEDSEDTQKTTLNGYVMVGTWLAFAAEELPLLFIYFHLKNQQVLICQNRKIILLLNDNKK
ncbi:MAG: hypothetical protein IJO19_05330 [Clostridia bacterium]|nr:hypothetical protein [Clostridia bacterium]